MLSALAVVLLLIGATLEIADLASAMVASFLIWFIGIEFGLSYAFMSFCVTAGLSFLFLPVKLPAFYFILLYGWYPLIKLFLEKRIRPRPICIAVKSAFAVIAVILEELLARWLLGYVQTALVTILIVTVSLVLYVPYDILLSRLAVIYIKKWRNHIFRH